MLHIRKIETKNLGVEHLHKTLILFEQAVVFYNR